MTTGPQPPPPIGLVREHPAYGPPVQPRPPADFRPEAVDPVPVPSGVQNSQPTALAGVLVALPPVVYQLAAAFGWFTFTGAQKTAVDSAYVFVTVVVFGWLYNKVYSPKTHAIEVNRAKEGR